jgi:hypothetical protein
MNVEKRKEPYVAPTMVLHPLNPESSIASENVASSSGDAGSYTYDGGGWK